MREVYIEAAAAALEALKKARRDMLIYREFGVVYDEDLMGALDVARPWPSVATG